ncbi:MAG: hypothetical protein PHX80_04000 [Candidatus Nanoarchaeia archaeon]|nr:hypothetical protein [Candidatus Nanoarchaeia archaeon]
MKTQFLVTPTLIDSIKWYFNCPDSWKKKAFEEISNTLNRIWTEPSEAVKRGIDFEKRICKSLVNSRDDFIKEHGELLSAFYDHCVGAEQQKVLKKIITIKNQDFLLYGRADIYFDEKIIDIKTTGKWRGKSSYLTKSQSYFYSYMSEIKPFEYLIAVFDGNNISDIKSVQIENAYVGAEKKIIDDVIMLIKFLGYYPDLDKAYQTIFTKGS